MSTTAWRQGDSGLSVFDRDRLERNGWRADRVEPSGPTPSGRFPARPSAKMIAALALSVLLFPILASIASATDFSGYVKPTALNVREEPGAKSSIAGILLKYDPVTVTGERRVGRTRWYSIKASGGYVTGWVAARFIARGEAPASTRDTNIDYGAHETPTLMRGDFKYVGVSVCADCHTDSTGDFPQGAVPVWQSHFHSQAHKTLKRDYTKQIAQRTRGVDDPATDWRCVKCHQSAFGAGPEQTASSYRPEEGVGCEVCHGPGSVYAEEDHGPEVPNREAMGFRVLRDLSDRREVCTSCHNQASPTFIGFDLREFSRKIAHWVDKDDAAYYAEYGKEATRRADRMTATTESSASGVTTAGAATGAAATKADHAAKQAAAEAARADAAAARAASQAAANAAAMKADQARADEAAAMKADQARADEA
ncbi:MAG: SH3 domain-containing protein, partial [Polyangiaceae bacterium]